MEETVDGYVLRSVPKGRGSPAPERAVFRLATQRRAARHLGAQRGGGTETDASPPCQPAPLLSPSRFLILPVPTWSSSELWSQRRSLSVGETQLVCVWRYQPVWSELWKICNSKNTSSEFKVQVWGRNLSRHKSVLRDGWVIWGDSLKNHRKPWTHSAEV